MQTAVNSIVADAEQMRSNGLKVVRALSHQKHWDIGLKYSAGPVGKLRRKGNVDCAGDVPAAKGKD